MMELNLYNIEHDGFIELSIRGYIMFMYLESLQSHGKKVNRDNKHENVYAHHSLLCVKKCTVLYEREVLLYKLTNLKWYTICDADSQILLAVQNSLQASSNDPIVKHFRDAT